MAKTFTLTSCDHCPNREHRGGFGRVAYVPYCRIKHRVIPHTIGVSRGMTVAITDDEIPHWCPLPDPK